MQTPEYHAARNLFERFRGFLELIRRFEFEFCRCGNYFFEGFEFLVRSCECAVACLCPRISISNVVASAIHDHTCIYTYIFSIGDVATNHETIAEGRVNRSLILGLGGERQIEH